MNRSDSYPLVSVCIPTYNSETTIKRVLDSVLSQTYANLEIIICDDQSKDQTIKIIKSYSDQRIKYTLNEINLGLIGNFNEVLNKATGDYIKILCADDIISTDCIEKQLYPFLNNVDKNIVMVTCEKWIINQEERVLFRKKFPGSQGVYNGIQVIRKVLRSGTNLIGEPGSVLFKRDISVQTTGFQIDSSLAYVVDLNFWFKMLLLGDLYVIKEPLFSFRVSKTSASAVFGKNQIKMFKLLIDKYSENKILKMSTLDKVQGYLFSTILTLIRNLIFKFAN